MRRTPAVRLPLSLAQQGVVKALVLSTVNHMQRRWGPWFVVLADPARVVVATAILVCPSTRPSSGYAALAQNSRRGRRFEAREIARGWSDVVGSRVMEASYLATRAVLVLTALISALQHVMAVPCSAQIGPWEKLPVAGRLRISVCSLSDREALSGRSRRADIFGGGVSRV